LPIEQVVPPQASAMPAPVDESTSEVSPRGQRQVRSSDRHVRMISYLLAGVLAGLMVVWWQAREAPQLETLDGRSPVTEEREAPIETVSPMDSEPQLPAEPVAEAEQPDTESSVPAPQEPETVAGEEEAAAEPNARVLRNSGGGTATPVGQVRLTLYYSANCWTEIRDARGKRLAYDTVAAGATLFLDGVPPFQIYFANAKAVSLQYNGRPYDLSSHIRRGFARFELGGPAAEH
jgi:cytoskeleton protein RodZ